jgi:TPR repeat protein
MESNIELNKFTELVSQYGIKLSKKEKYPKEVIIKLINLYENDTIDNKCQDTLYIKYLGMYHQYKTKDYDKMEDAYFILLNKGDTNIMLKLGDFYSEIEPDFNEMKRFYLMAIKKGNNEGFLKLAEYFKKKNTLYYKKCLEKGLENSNCNKLVEQGYYYQYTEKNYDLMKKYYQIAINKGSAIASNNLGVYHQDILYNFKEAERLYKISADQGCIYAMNNLGLLYQRSNKYEEMERYFQLAINKNDSDAMYNMGLFYETISLIPEIALQYYHMAFEKGNEKAKIKLGELNIQNNII